MKKFHIERCQHCGGIAFINMCIPCGFVHVECTECGATGPNFTITSEAEAEAAEEKAVNAWNRRIYDH